MDFSQNQNLSRKVYVDYVPAELQGTENNDWRIVYYVRIPGTEKMKRYRVRVKPLKSRKSRKRYAHTICEAINQKLLHGWSPLVDGQTAKEFTTIYKALDIYLEHQEQMTAKNQLRPASLIYYTSMVKKLKEYLTITLKEELLCSQYNRFIIRSYIDHIHLVKGRSPRTANNYLQWCSSFAYFLVEREYLQKNTIVGITPLKTQKKKRELIPIDTRKEIFEKLKKENPPFLVCCLMVYYCFIRRTEMTRLKVKDIHLKEGIIVVPAHVSKNKKEEAVTIPKNLVILLAQHLNKAKQDDYLFSGRHFLPGEIQLKPKKISDTWAKMRTGLQFKETYQFYSLKDTGITQLFLQNIPLIKIRDQARHYDIKITETYTPRKFDKDELLAQIDFEF